MIMRVSFDAIGLFRFYEIEIMYYKLEKYIIDLTKHQNKTSFLLNGHKHPTCLKRQVM